MPNKGQQHSFNTMQEQFALSKTLSMERREENRNIWMDKKQNWSYLSGNEILHPQILQMQHLMMAQGMNWQKN